MLTPATAKAAAAILMPAFTHFQVMGLSPAAIEAAETEAESSVGSAVGDGGAGAMGGGGGDGGDGGGYGGVGSAFLEISPVDLPMGKEGYE